MNAELSNFAARLARNASRLAAGHNFDRLALELFALQFKHNPAYRKICEARRMTPDTVEHWTQVPFVPTAAFKELELSSIPPQERTAVFHSSGTTEQKPSRHFHNVASMKVYEEMSWSWFAENILMSASDYGGHRPPLQWADSDNSGDGSLVRQAKFDLIVLTPPPLRAPHSSLVHMFETARVRLGAPESVFVGGLAADGAWVLDFDSAIDALNHGQNPKLILGTAFSFVHLLDFLAEKNLRLFLPENSRVMETGGYKNRSRTMPKSELHLLITRFLNIQRENIICEYGMSELSSQAYDAGNAGRALHFPPWARAQIISPETGREVGQGEQGLVRLFDLANVFSVAAIQTEDLGARRGGGFELIGRAALAEARGCSLMTA